MVTGSILSMVVGGMIAGSIGFLFGILKEHPKISNAIFKYIRVKLHDIEYKTENNALRLITGKYTVTNGQPNPVYYNEVAVEFNDMDITTTNVHAATLAEVLDRKEKKWILYNQELFVSTSTKQDFALDNKELFQIIDQHPQLKIRIAIDTYRYGKIRSKWKSINY